MAEERDSGQSVWLDNKVANIQYIKEVDIFRQSYPFDICTEHLA